MLWRYGKYKAVFKQGELSVPSHLVLLNLSNPGRSMVLDRIESANRNGGKQKHIDRMFKQANWRPHLVSAWALLLDVDGSFKSDQIWSAIDMGSWVCPQLIAAAELVTDNFRDQVASRLDPSYSVQPPVGLSSIERHSATGPAGTQSRNAKLINVLQEAVGFDVACSMAGHDVVEKAMEADIDNASDIYRHWRSAMLETLKERGISYDEM